jgi:hypothetical protein
LTALNLKIFLTGEGCSGILACFHEAEGLDILCHHMVELIGLKLDNERVRGLGIISRLMGQGIVTINDAC